MRSALRILISIAALSIGAAACGADDAAVTLAGALRDVSTGDIGADAGEGDDDANASLDVSIEDTDNPGLDVAVEEDTADETGSNCGEIAICVQENECATQACLDSCLADGSTGARADFMTFYNCLAANCSDAGEAEMLGCQTQYCSEEFTQCTGSPLPTGDADCPTTVGCLLSCTSQSCADDCVENASVDGANLAADYYNCGLDNCATSTTQAAFMECLAEACPGEAAACEGGM